MVTTLKNKTDSSPGDFLNQYTDNSEFSWPTIALFVFVITSFSSATYLALNEIIPLALAILINATASYVAYTVVHEASHGGVCKNKLANFSVGTISLFFITLTPFFSTYQYLHMTHHRHTNIPNKDPDYFCGSGPKWMLPFRWILMDVAYVTAYFTMGYYPKRPKKEKIGFWISVVFGLSVLSIVISLGFFVEFIFLYFIPTRIALFFLAIMFDYLPHYPHKINAHDNKYQATNNRVGLEWLLTPLFLGQNYHLSHHLYPNVPFYRYRKIWLERKTFHDSCHSAEVKYYKLTPE